MKVEHRSLIILGSGPAGYSSAVYAARAGLTPTIISGPQKGGQLTTTTIVDNWPGAFEGIDGSNLVMNMQKHAQRFGVEQIDDTIISSDLQQRPFKLVGQDTQYTCDALIIATGASAKYLGLPSEQSFHGKGVSACATCDGFFFRKQEVAVVGGGNTAVEEAIFLSNICSKVILVHRRDSLRAEKIEQDHLFELEKQGKVQILWSKEVVDFLGNDAGLTHLKLRDRTSGENMDLPVSGAFIAIGHEPNSKIFVDQLDMDHGYIKIRSGQSGMATQTSIEGVFAAGDVSDFIYRQAITSAGSGCMAALDAERYLQSVK